MFFIYDYKQNISPIKYVLMWVILQYLGSFDLLGIFSSQKSKSKHKLIKKNKILKIIKKNKFNDEIEPS
jgi:hypothetical protein